MSSTYVNDLRLEEIGSGEQSGTWGDTTNTNLELIAEGLSYGTEGITTNADTHTSTVADGATDPARSMYIKYTGTLDSDCTITIAPNTISRVHFIENATSGSQNIIISQGSGANVTIPPGDTKAVYLDGAGSGAAVVDAFASLSVVDLKVQDDLTVTDDATVGGTLGVTGVVTANAGVVVDNITIDGTEIGISSGDLTIAANHASGDLIFEANGATWYFTDGGATQFSFQHNSGNITFNTAVSNDDFIITGVDDGSAITALTLDMSEAGAATFNSTATFGGTITGTNITLGTTLEGWGANSHVIQLGDGTVDNGALAWNTISGGDVFDLMYQSYFDGTNYKYAAGSAAVSRISQYVGAINFDRKEGGTNDATFTWDRTMSLDTSGNVIIGNGVSHVDVNTGPDITIGSNGNADADGSAIGFVHNGNTLNAYIGGQKQFLTMGTYTSTDFRLITANTERVRIDSTGFVTIQGESLTTNLRLNGRSSDNNFYTLYKTNNGGTTKASFGTDTSNDNFFYQVDNHTFQNLSSDTTYMKINSDGNVGIGSTIPSNSYKFINQNSTNQIVQLTYNSNASFTQDAHAWDTNRAANSAFNFFRARTNVAGSPDSEMILTGEGNFNIDGTVTENGADYAEYFEWKDGNSDNEDRVGITVKLDGDKIVPSTSDDNASVIIGVISGKPSVVGDSAWNKWKNKHQTDDYGRYVWEEYTVTEWTIPATDTEEAVHHSYHTDYIPSDLTAPSDATVISKEEDGTNLMRRKLNSSYNPSTTYIPRSKRKEWDTVGLVGKLRITKGQKTGTNWIKMRDISENVEEWLVK
jgi:hypothetical protein